MFSCLFAFYRENRHVDVILICNVLEFRKVSSYDYQLNERPMEQRYSQHYKYR